MSESGKPAWFGPKRVGWGISPKTWQGWAITIAFCAIFTTLVFVFA